MAEENEHWYTRPIFAVSDLAQSIEYYCERLGFRQDWKHTSNDEDLVAQVARGDLEIILAANLDRVGMGRVFVSLTESEHARLVATIAENALEFDEIHWGYPSLRLRDPDGNELLVPEASDH